jgi:hypothetical protein
MPLAGRGIEVRMLRLFILLSCLLLSTSCSADRDISLARAAVNEFHGRLKSRQFERIFADATPDYQRAMSAEASQAFFVRMSTSLGSPVSCQVTRVQVNHMPRGTLIVVQAETKFDRGSAQEQFTWRVEGQGTRLVAYTASSPDLGS